MKTNSFLCFISSLLMVVCVSGCSGGQYKTNTTPEVVIGALNGAVYQGDTLLPGNYPLNPSTYWPLTQSGFTLAGQYVTCVNTGLIFTNGNPWEIINPTPISLVNSCALSTNPINNNNINFSYGDASGNIYAYSLVNTNWQLLGNGLLPESGSAVGIVNDALGNTYVAVENSDSSSAYVFSTNNGGWTKLANSALPNNFSISLSSLVVGADNTIYVGGSDSNNVGMVYTISNTDQWESVGNIPDGSSVTNMVANQSGVLFVGTQNGHVYQLSGGNSWQQIYTTPTASVVEALATDAQNNLYIATGDGYVYKYVNSNWEQVGNAPIPDSPIFTLAVSNTGQVVVGSKTGSVYKIVDNAWQPMVTGAASSSSIITTHVNSATGVIYIAGIESSDYNLYVSSWNGEFWSVVNNSPLPFQTNGMVRSLANDSENNLYALAFSSGSAGVYVSQNNQWSLVNNQTLPIGGFTSSFIVSPNAKQIYVASTVNNTIPVVFESVNGSWGIVNNAPLSIANSGIGPILMDNSNNLFAATGGVVNLLSESSSAVYESVNGSWVQINQSIPNDEVIMAMVADNKNNLFIGTFTATGTNNINDVFQSSGNVYESVNGTWKLITPTLPTTIGGVTDIQFDNQNNMYVSTFLGYVYSYQNGMWVLIKDYNYYTTSFALKG